MCGSDALGERLDEILDWITKMKRAERRGLRQRTFTDTSQLHDMTRNLV
jgi:hypothetical protein